MGWSYPHVWQIKIGRDISTLEVPLRTGKLLRLRVGESYMIKVLPSWVCLGYKSSFKLAT